MFKNIIKTWPIKSIWNENKNCDIRILKQRSNQTILFPVFQFFLSVKSLLIPVARLKLYEVYLMRLCNITSTNLELFWIGFFNVVFFFFLFVLLIFFFNSSPSPFSVQSLDELHCKAKKFQKLSKIQYKSRFVLPNFRCH